MATDEKARMDQLKKIEIHPYSERGNPRPRGFIRPEGKKWIAAHPRGMKYWERLADAINREHVFERDRFFMAMLKPLGIEKGKPFNPTPEQKKILTEATLVGEAMAKANDFAKRMEEAHYVDGAQWHFATVAAPDQRAEYYDQLDERAAWLYEAVTNDPAMHGQVTGKGQIYLGTYKDNDGDWLDGGKNYVLHVPADVPAETFWSITLYDVDTRCLIQNEQKIADRSSRMDLLTNADGSVYIYMGPDAPKGQREELDTYGSGKGLVSILPAIFTEEGVSRSYMGVAGHREGEVIFNKKGKHWMKTNRWDYLVVLIFVLTLSGCASQPKDQIMLMPAPDVFDQGDWDPFTDRDPIKDIPYGGILYATDREPAQKEGQYYLDERGHVLRLGVAQVTAGKEGMTWEEARRISLLKERPEDYPLKVTDVRTDTPGADSGNGHAYFRKSPWTSSDILATLTFDLKPEERGLEQVGGKPSGHFRRTISIRCARVAKGTIEIDFIQ